MNKVSIFSLIFVTFLVTGSAYATVGGATYVSEIAYNAAQNAIYYKVNDEGGRGCPPIIHKINIATLKDTEVKSCTEVEQEFLSGEYEQGVQRYSQFMHDIYEGLPYLGSVSLKKNNIDVKVEFLSEYKGENDEYGYVVWSDFSVAITQDDKEITKINFRGCAKDQPHVFEGFMIRNSDAMAMLISNKGDCFEGGYVKETLSIIKGIKYYDKNIVRDIKQATATEPNLGNIVAYVTTVEDPQPEAPLPLSKTNDRNIIYIILGAGLVLGIVYSLVKKARS